MPRLPIPGSDNNTWGDILNAYLSVSHASDGTLNSGVVGTSQLQDNSVTNAKLDIPTQTTIASVASKYTKPGTGIPSTDLTAAVQTSLGKADNAAVDANVVHLAGTETITGAKNFTGTLQHNTNAVVDTTDSRLSDQRVPTDGSVTDTKIAAGGLTNASISTTAAIARTKLDAGTQTSLTKADNAIPTTQLGVASGVATLDGTTKLTASQLPGSVVSGSSLTRTFASGGDVVEVFDAAIATGSAVLSTAHTFVSADAGKHIEVDGAGTGGAVLVTTILSVASGVATLAATASTTVASAGHARWGTDTSGALTSLISTLGPQGTILIAPGTYWIAPITLLDGQTLSGLCSGFAARLVLKAGSNAPIISNSLTGSLCATRLTVADLWLDGNAPNQTSGHGISWASGTSSLAGDFAYDTLNRVSNVLIYKAAGDGVNCSGRGEQTFQSVQCRWCLGNGFVPTWDTYMLDCRAEYSGLAGFSLTQNPIMLVSCKAYYSGQVTPASGYGFSIIGVNSGGVGLTNCNAQDNQMAGFFFLSTSGALLTGCVADSNSGSSPGSFPGFDFWAATLCTLKACVAFDRKAALANVNASGAQERQYFPLRIRSASTGNNIEIVATAYGSSGSSISYTAIANITADSQDNRIVTNNQLGIQHVTYASSITPAPFSGGTIAITLTGAITINNTAGATTNGPYVGQEMEFQFTQDGTGGRAIAWGNQYKLLALWSPLLAANEMDVIRFCWDGTYWQQVGGDVYQASSRNTIFKTPTTSVSNGTMTANKSTGGAVQIPYACTLTGLAFCTASAATGNVIAAIYDHTGALVAHSNSTALTGTYAMQFVPFAATVAIAAGTYYIALVASLATDHFYIGASYGSSFATDAGSFTYLASITPPAVATGQYIPDMSTY